MKSKTLGLLALGLLASPLASAGNIISDNWTLLSSTGFYSVLRPGSIWEPAPTPASQFSVVDNVILPASTQWNDSSWWWDQDPSVNPDISLYPRPMGLDITLNGVYTMNRFVVQADDNDTYQLDYWDGSFWQSLWTIPAVGGWGLQTRDSGLLSPISTDRLRFYALSGDGYYSVSEIQAFFVPEPGTLALLGLGLFGLGVSRRRKA